jgi:hypothetical protein
VAPCAGVAGADRLEKDLGLAIIEAGAQATISWAAHPVDGTTEDALLRSADRRLYERKARRQDERLAEPVSV